MHLRLSFHFRQILGSGRARAGAGAALFPSGVAVVGIFLEVDRAVRRQDS